MAQLVPTAIAAPRTARLGYGIAPERALTIAYVVIGVAMVTTGAAMAAALPPPAVYGLAATVVVAYTSVRPIQTSILLSLVGRAEQLTAANALTTIIEGAGVLIGPLLCGLLIALASRQRPISLPAARRCSRRSSSVRLAALRVRPWHGRLRRRSKHP